MLEIIENVFFFIFLAGYLGSWIVRKNTPKLSEITKSNKGQFVYVCNKWKALKVYSSKLRINIIWHSISAIGVSGLLILYNDLVSRLVMFLIMTMTITSLFHCLFLDSEIKRAQRLTRSTLERHLKHEAN